MGRGAKTFNWTDIGDNRNLNSEELLLTNTFLNAKPQVSLFSFHYYRLTSPLST